MTAKPILIGLLFIVHFVRIRGYEPTKVHKFTHSPGVLLKVDTSYKFYNHVEFVGFKIPQNLHPIPRLAVNCEANTTFCRSINAMDKFNGAHTKLSNIIQGVFHEGGESFDLNNLQQASWDEVLYNDDTSDTHNDIMNNAQNMTFLLDTARNGKSREKRAYAKIAMKIAPYIIPLFLKGKQTTSINDLLKASALPGYAKFHKDIETVPKILEAQTTVVNSLTELNHNAKIAIEELQTSRQEDSTLMKQQMEYLLYLLTAMTTEIAENTQNMLTTHSNTMCIIGHLPATSLPKSIFDKNYLFQQENLDSDREMLVDIKDTSVYYTESFTKCVLSELDAMAISPIMSIRKNHRYELVDIIPIVHQKGDLGSCKHRLSHTKVLFDKDSENIIPLSSSLTFDCLKNTKYCEIPQIFSINEREITCITGLLTNNVYKIQECELECSRSQLPSVQINYEDNSLYVANADKVEVNVHNKLRKIYAGANIYGVLKISLPCNSIVKISGINNLIYGSSVECFERNVDAIVQAPANFFPVSEAGNIKGYRTTGDFSNLVIIGYISSDNIFVRFWQTISGYNAWDMAGVLWTYVAPSLGLLYAILAIKQFKLEQRGTEDDIRLRELVDEAVGNGFDIVDGENIVSAAC